MKNRVTMSLGDLVVAAFDIAATQATNPRDIARLATSAIAKALRTARPLTSLADAPRIRPHGCRSSGVLLPV